MKAKTDTKRALIDATKEFLCEDKGFTVKEISERAFTNVAAINYHFGDKSSLVLIALDELLAGFKSEVVVRFGKNFDNNEKALEDALQFLFEAYGRLKGAVKYILLFEDPELETRLVEKFFFEKEFIEVFMARISEVVEDKDPDMLFYRLSVVISAFLFPLLVEGKSSSIDDKISLTALRDENNRRAFIKTVMLLFK